MQIKFNKEYLAVLAAFAAKNDVRAYLNGFHIKPHPEKRGVILTATNGHTLVTIYDEYGISDGEYLLPITKEFLTASKKAKGKDKIPLNEIQILDDKAYVLHSEEDVVDWLDIEEPDHIERIYHVEYISPMGGEYPNTKRIFSALDFKPVNGIKINASYVGNLAAICLESRIPNVDIMFCGVEGSIVAIGGIDKEITALIMPCHDQGIDYPMPLPEYVFQGGGIGVKTQEEKAEVNLDLDPLYTEAVDFVKETRRVSVSSIQRKFRIGYNRAARLVEQLEENKVISVAGHNGAREVLI